MRSNEAIPTLSAAQQALVTEHLYISGVVASRMCKARPYLTSHQDDLIQEARLGIMLATAKYDPARGPFATLAWDYARSFAWAASLTLTRPVSTPDGWSGVFETTPAEDLQEESAPLQTSSDSRLDAQTLLNQIFEGQTPAGSAQLEVYVTSLVNDTAPPRKDHARCHRGRVKFWQWVEENRDLH